MHNSRLGCFTSTGIIATLITGFAIVGAVLVQGGTLYSPGALNAQAGETLGGVTSHAQIGKDCKACHTAPWESAHMADRCAACHTDIAAQMFDVAKLHGLITKKSPTLACRDCHPDHRGPSAALTDLGSNTFPHETLGFSLNGHQQKVTREAFVCADCHTQSIAAFDQAVCADCHNKMDAAFSQKHTLDYGTDCLACHDGADRFGKSFTHANFPFRLDGKHAQVNCAQCHANARVLADFQSTPTDCFSCHQKDDQHSGQFGTDCGACHQPGNWADATFDHNRSAFKLEGKHANVKCEQCHQNGVFKGTPTDCYSCHADPAFHVGAFGTDCASCHNVNGWSPAQFNLSHPQPAGGEGGGGIFHGGASCRQCHPDSVHVYTCLSCHSNNQGAGGGD
jgi:hypothetical protein